MKIATTHKASSLTSAIFICLIISVFCGCLVLIHHFNILLNSKIELQNHLVNRNDSAFNYFLNNSSLLENTNSVDVFDDKIQSYAEIKNWGFFNVLTCKSIFKTDTVYKTAMVGKRSIEKQPLALYVTNYDKPLKLSGEINIIGTLKVPNGRVEYAYINNQNSNKIQIKGVQLNSEDFLPKLKTRDFNLQLESSFPHKVLNYEETIINDFNNGTLFIDYEEIRNLKNISLKGNIILESKSTITLRKESNLEDILVIAPRVIVENGFRGNVQIIAKSEVVIQENAYLYYPSSIYVKNEIDSVKIHINRNSKIAGGIVIDSETYKSSLKKILIIDEGAKVMGNVYCKGKTQFNGEIIGSLFTDRFFLKTNSSSYENIIFNGTINRGDLPKDFIGLPLFDNEINDIKYEIIKTL